MLKCAKRSSVLVLCAWCASAAMASASTLEIGDKAPALSPMTWVHGSPVDLASRDRSSQIVVLEFWTTWHPSSAKRLLALNQLQQSFRKKDVRVISCSSGSEKNSLEVVRWRVSSLGEPIDHTVGFDESGRTEQAYVDAIGVDYYPVTFVIDKAGRLAWFGKPSQALEDVLGEMVKGTYDIDVAKQVAVIRRRIVEPQNLGNLSLRLKGLDEWIALRPSDPRPHMSKFRLHAYDSHDYKRARAAAMRAIEVASDRPFALATFSTELAEQDIKNGFAPLALRAANRATELAPENRVVVRARFDALLVIGREKEALSWLENSVVPTLSTPESRRTLADMVASSSRSRVCNELALRIIDGAIQMEPEDTANLFSKFRIQAICLEDQKAAEATGRAVLEMAWDTPRVLSGFAYDLLERSETRSRYAAIALSAIERASNLAESKSWWMLRVLAIAKSETGSPNEAIKIQKEAIKECGDAVIINELKHELRRFERKAK